MSDKEKKEEINVEELEELTPEELDSVSGGKTAMPAGALRNYRLLKVPDANIQEKLGKRRIR
jgi:hypothetical protein